MSVPARAERTLKVNGESHVAPEASTRLLSFLRDELSLTGAKFGCGEGSCGACTVLVGGRPVFSCQATVGEVGEEEVTTIEGADSPVARALQEALAAEGASQCGYCSPGMVLRASALLEGKPRPSEAEVREAMSANLCRCGCYKRLTAGILRAAGATATATATATNRVAGETPGEGFRPARPFDLTPPEERQWFELLGDGIIATSSPALEAASAGRSGAWIHLSPSGEVTAFCGKVDVGQDNTTAFRLLVAEELSVDPGQVGVVLGDTDLCPYDMGTFASRSMPDAGEALCQVAAGLRHHLEAKAAARLGLPARAVQAREGAVRSDGAVLDYGELATGARVVEVVGPGQRLLAPSRRLPAGPIRPSRRDAFSGARRFVSDMRLPGMAIGLVIHPPAPGDKLARIDRAALAGMAGVQLVEEEGFVGLVADDLAAGLAGLRALSPQFETGAPSFSDLEEYLRHHPAEPGGWAGRFEEASGELDEGLAGASFRFEATYTAPFIAHVPLETRAALARFDRGRLTVHVGTQTPFRVRAELAEALGMDEADIRVIVGPTGGAFGGKHGSDVALEAARLSRAAGRAVLVHWTRREEFTSGYLRPAAVIDVRAGLGSDGALASFELVDTNAGAAGLSFPYRAAARRLRFQPSASPLPQGSYRALAATANHFARESAIDELAAIAGKDPASYRLALLEDRRLAELLELALERFGWQEKSSEERGLGVALGLEKGGRVVTCVEVRSDREGFRVARVLTAYDCGRLVNRDAVANQVEGATMMALGGALFEEICLRQGRQQTTRLSEYRLPRFEDLPALEVELLDRPEEPAAGAGETPMVAVAPAVANALFDASGLRLRSLPLLPAYRREVG